MGSIDMRHKDQSNEASLRDSIGLKSAYSSEVGSCHLSGVNSFLSMTILRWTESKGKIVIW